MARTPTDIDQDLRSVRMKLLDGQCTHQDLFTARFVEKTMPHADFVKLSTANREEAYRLQQQEEVLAKELHQLKQP